MRTSLFPIPGPWRGSLSIVPRPRGGDWLADEAEAWRQTGIDTVVSLLEPDEAAQFDLLGEGAASEQNGIRFISFPIPDRGVPESTPAAVSLISDLAGALDRGRNIAVHCRQSIGRAGMIAAGILVAAGVSPEDSLEAVTAARGAEVPETAQQREWIRSLPAGLAVVFSR